MARLPCIQSRHSKMDNQSLPILIQEDLKEAKMKINIKECTIVRPQQETPNTRIWLSNLDLIHKLRHMPTMKFYKNTNGAFNFFDPKLLKESLSKVLIDFYPVAGRLARGEEGRLEINCNGEGVIFLIAETETPMSDLGEDFLPTKELQQLVPKVDYSSVQISESPLLLVQVTTFKCGGVCLGIGMSHHLADGAGATNFMTSWASVARGGAATNKPFFDRTLLRARSTPTPKFHHQEFDSPPTLINPSQSQSDHCAEILEITLDQLNKLKAKAGKSSTDNQATNEYYSAYEVLTAHIWRCASKARGLSHDQPTQVQISVDGRARLEPKLPQGYFGNVILIATSIALSGELISEPFKESVDRVRKAIKKMDNEYFRSAIDFLQEQDDLTPFMLTEQRWRSPNVKVVSWMRLPFYDMDFGWGMPFCMRTTSVSEGKGHLLAKNGSVDDRNLLLAICLETNHMPLFKKYLGLVD